MDFSFESVGKFLQQAQAAKEGQRAAINKGMEPLLDDPAVFAIAPNAADALDKAMEDYGDEALKQTAMVAMGKWCELHQEWLGQHIMHESASEAAVTASDMAKIIQAIKLLDEVGSFSGDETYRKAIKQQINQAVLEKLEEDGRDANEVFSDYDDPLL
jgi:hypothetical protein